ncbi:MATE family efflux transporter [Sphingosinicella sp. BN140058]|uniref:MATE family efflux transporter n=1 Tax=Sphingosinicella sp. BN140058 TaxID=1892855 RepID=UPI001010DE11|nr:MATE family efflux transporter [Sphingosinicella sp. BN140058]QAY75456.1 MATE family efflux transporter [Sphingosinicella sp. BN140058]
MASRPTARPGQRDLTSGPIASTLLAFAIPTLGSSVLQSLNGSINAIWVGRFLGEDALAATANGNIVLFMLLAFVFGFGMASTILVGQAFGRRDVAEARRVVGTAIGSFVPVAAVVALIGWLTAPHILGLLGTPGDAMPLALAYLRVIFVAMPAALMMTMLMMTLRGSGDSLTPLWFMALSVALDSGLNPVFILGLGPAPALGIAGSATATAVANYVSLFALLAYIYARDLPLRLRGPELAWLRPDPARLRVIVGKGFPMGLQMIVITSSALAMLSLVNREGVHTAAAYGVTQQLWTYVQMPAMALGAAVSAMAAQNIGAGNWDRVSAVTRAGVIFNVVLTGALILLLTVADRPALALFMGGDSPALPIARHIQLVGTWGFLFFGVSLVLFGTVRANGQVIGPLIILFISMYPVRLGVALGAYSWLGADALWLSFPIGMVTTMLMAIALYLHGGWRKGRIGPTPPPDEIECREQAEATREPGGALNPAG